VAQEEWQAVHLVLFSMKALEGQPVLQLRSSWTKRPALHSLHSKEDGPEQFLQEAWHMKHSFDAWR
jgi:hypothetical protein